jgi:hypothetical protein
MDLALRLPGIPLAPCARERRVVARRRTGAK